MSMILVVGQTGKLIRFLAMAPCKYRMDDFKNNRDKVTIGGRCAAFGNFNRLAS